jgi:hypothetical protein
VTQLLITSFRPHKWTFISITVALNGMNIVMGAPWWAVWPLLGWGLAFSIHFFIYKSLTVDEEWTDERIDDLRWRSYDLGHVEDLETRILSDDFSTRPAHRRDPNWWQTAEERAAANNPPANPDRASDEPETAENRDTKP